MPMGIPTIRATRASHRDNMGGKPKKKKSKKSKKSKAKAEQAQEAADKSLRLKAAANARRLEAQEKLRVCQPATPPFVRRTELNAPPYPHRVL